MPVTFTDFVQSLNIRSLWREVKGIKATVSQLMEFVHQFRDDVDAETTRIAGVLEEMKQRLDAGDAAAAQEVSTELSPIINNLHALGSGGNNDPLPQPPAEPPAESGTPEGSGAAPSAGDSSSEPV